MANAVCNRIKRTDECERRAEEDRYLPLRDDVEPDRADAGAEQGNGYGEARQQRDKNGGSKHGEYMLETQNQHFAGSKLFEAIIDAFDFLFH